MFGELTILNFAIIVFSIVLSVGIHEAMHALVAHKLGDPTASDLGRITLNPLAHIDLLTTVALPIGLILLGLPPFFIAKPVPFRPDLVKFGELGAALVGLAGPVSNLLLALLGAAILNSGIVGANVDAFGALLIFIQINVALFVFNMIPFPPLDGSRVLYAVAPDFLRRIMERIEALGFGVIIVFILLVYPFISQYVVAIMTSIMRLIL